MRTGRPSLLTQAVQLRICDLIAKGVTFRDACLDVGVAEDTGRGWLIRGRDDNATGPESVKFRNFTRAVTRAKGAFRLATNLALHRAIQGGDIIGERTETERNSKGAVIAERKEVRKTAPNGPLALKVLQHKDPKTYKPEPEGGSVSVTLIQQIRAMQTEQSQLVDPREIIEVRQLAERASADTAGVGAEEVEAGSGNDGAAD